jgi:type I restriction enzyme M protein
LSEEELSSHILCPHYYDPKIEEELSALQETHEFHKLGDLVKDGTLQIQTGDELGKLSYGTGEIPFIRTSDISNWEIKYDAKHGVDRDLFEKMKKKQDVKPYDILMVRDGTYLIGTCAIITEEEYEILYQSHIYKIRVKQNQHGVTPFLLLAVLSSPVVQRQIRAKRFTQDIIDTLGERIRELVLPIPREPKERQEISNLVEAVIRKRGEARQIAQEAREKVGAKNGQIFAVRNAE